MDYPLADGVTYGPVKSRRLGTSLGVNILPFGVKVCSFNCSYCQCGWTTDAVDHASLKKYAFPTPDAIEAGLLATLRAPGAPKLDCITIAGNGEPTLHPRFADAVRAVLRARDQAAPGVRVDVLSNGAHLDRDDVVEGLNLLDVRFIKIDAGDESTFLDMNTPVTPTSLEDVLAGCRRLKDFVAQSMFCRGRIDNTTPDVVAAWVRTLGQARPLSVQVYSISRYPADPRLEDVPRARLDEIAAALTKATGIKADVYS